MTRIRDQWFFSAFSSLLQDNFCYISSVSVLNWYEKLVLLCLFGVLDTRRLGLVINSFCMVFHNNYSIYVFFIYYLSF